MNSPLYVLLQNMFQEKLFKEEVFYLLSDQLNALFLLAAFHHSSDLFWKGVWPAAVLLNINNLLRYTSGTKYRTVQLLSAL